MITAKKILFVILMVLLLATILAVLSGKESIIVPLGSSFLVVWGVDKSRCWYVGEPIGLRAGLEIPANASTPLRLLGLAFALFVTALGVLAFFQHFPT